MALDDQSPREDDLRQRIMGMGNQSMRKSYYSVLQHRLDELERYKKLLDRAHDGIFLLEPPTLRITDFTHAALHLLGVTEQEMATQTLLDLLPVDAADPIRAWAGHLYADTPASIKVAFRPEQAQVRAGLSWLELSLSAIRESGQIDIVGILRDVSELYLQKKAMEDSERRLHALFDNSFQFIGILDAEGRLRNVNRTALSFIHAKEDDVLGQYFWNTPWWHGLPDEQTHLKESFPRCLQGETVHFICQNSDGQGQQVWVDFSMKPVRDEDGHICMVVPEGRDITETRMLEEQLRQSQKMEAIGQLAGGVAHDFNNMLGGILGAAEVMEWHVKDRPEALKFLKLIISSSERAADLTSKLLAFARKQPIASTPIDVLETLRDALALLERTIDPRIRIERNVMGESFEIVGDPAQLQSSFLNLFINATRAMPDGGTLTVTATMLPLSANDRPDAFSRLDAGNYVSIKIRDTGCGIAPEHLPHIFEPFFTTRRSGEGTGLGLAAVLGTVQQHRGAIDVQSHVGLGTCFQILLPLTGETARAISSSRDMLKHGTGRILLVDDESVMRITASAILENLGYEVLTAENGKEALAIYRKDPDRIDLIILDMVMPEMNGRDCLSALQQIRPGVRVLLSSGFAREEDMQSMKTAGICGFIRKPFRGMFLSQAVSAALKPE